MHLQSSIVSLYRAILCIPGEPPSVSLYNIFCIPLLSSFIFICNHSLYPWRTILCISVLWSFIFIYNPPLNLSGWMSEFVCPTQSDTYLPVLSLGWNLSTAFFPTPSSPSLWRGWIRNHPICKMTIDWITKLKRSSFANNHQLWNCCLL